MELLHLSGLRYECERCEALATALGLCKICEAGYVRRVPLLIERDDSA